MSAATPQPRAGLLDRLRTLVPKTGLSQADAVALAERQATALLDELGQTGPPVATQLLADLPFVTVTYKDRLGASGITLVGDIGWIIAIRASETPERQRFTLAHELKHVLDASLGDELYLARTRPDQHRRAEEACDAFAAALLMPELWLRVDLTNGLTDLAVLAQRYGVEASDMAARLAALGVQPTPKTTPQECAA